MRYDPYQNTMRISNIWVVKNGSLDIKTPHQMIYTKALYNNSDTSRIFYSFKCSLVSCLKEAASHSYDKECNHGQIIKVVNKSTEFGRHMEIIVIYR